MLHIVGKRVVDVNKLMITISGTYKDNRPDKQSRWRAVFHDVMTAVDIIEEGPTGRTYEWNNYSREYVLNMKWSTLPPEEESQLDSIW